MRDCLCEFTLCEMRRTSLEDLVLTVLLLELGHPQEFLQKGETVVMLTSKEEEPHLGSSGFETTIFSVLFQLSSILPLVQ